MNSFFKYVRAYMDAAPRMLGSLAGNLQSVDSVEGQQLTLTLTLRERMQSGSFDRNHGEAVETSSVGLASGK